jgi:hypothetical protein
MAMLENLVICEFLGYRERGCKVACDGDGGVIYFPQLDLNTPASIRILAQESFGPLSWIRLKVCIFSRLLLW